MSPLASRIGSGRFAFLQGENRRLGRGLGFHKFRALILVDPAVALFAYERIRRDPPPGARPPTRPGNANIIVSTLAYYSRIMIKYPTGRVGPVLRARVAFRRVSIVSRDPDDVALAN